MVLIINAPVHDMRRMRFDSPSEMKQRLLSFPVDERYIEWMAEQSFRIYYNPDFHYRGLTSWDDRSIRIQKPLDRFALMHELVHVAVPDSRLLLFSLHRLKEDYERAISEVAEVYINGPLPDYANTLMKHGQLALF